MDILQLLDCSKRVLVIGDVILDRYINGRCDRVAPDIAVPVLTILNKDYELGGAGNVVCNLIEMCFSVEFVTIIGEKDEAIINLLKEKGISEDGILRCPNYRVKVVSRYFANRHQFLRVDKHVDSKVEDLTENRLRDLIKNKMTTIKYDAIVLSDYRKGIFSEKTTKEIISEASVLGIPTIVDPKRGNYQRFQGATYIKPNKEDVSYFMDNCVVTESNIHMICKLFCERFNIEYCILTLAEDGIAFYKKDESDGLIFGVLPTIKNVDVVDVCGAGDTCLAAIVFGACHQWPLDKTCNFANICAANVIEKYRTIPVRMLDIIHRVVYSQKELVNIRRLIPKESTIVLTTGCFDLFHDGHIESLRQAKDLGDLLFVALNSDISVKKNKGDKRPIIPEKDRLTMIMATKYVDFVVMFDEEVPFWIVDTLDPDIFVKGPDRTEADLRKRFPDIKQIHITDSKGISTSGIIEKIRKL